MNIYVIHSTRFDFFNQLYEPLNNSELSKVHNIILPHEEGRPFTNSKEIIKNSDLIIAEVSYSSISMGIELGWADVFCVPILCVYKKDVQITKSLGVISKYIIEYTDSSEMINVIEKFIENMGE